MGNVAADRLSQLPPYLFVEIDRLKREATDAGRDVIDFGVGDPDLPTPTFIVDRLKEAVGDPCNHRYAHGVGSAAFRGAIARFFSQRFGVMLDPDREIVSLLGSKEGVGHLPTAIVNPGEIVLVPEPGYPVYVSGAVFAGAECFTMPLCERNGFLPQWEDIPSDIRSRAKLMWLNYPNNPTAAIAPRSFFEEAVAFAREYNILIAHDAAYSELYFEKPPPSILEIAGARDVAVEFHSLSKTFNMTGWRVAFAVGRADVLAALAKVKNNLDSGIFGAVQESAIIALGGIDRPERRELLDTYRRRRDALVGTLREAGWSVNSPEATFYVWTKYPGSMDSMGATKRILEDAGVVVVPGGGFGEAGEGYVRFALTVPEARILEAGKRISTISW